MFPFDRLQSFTIVSIVRTELQTIHAIAIVSIVSANLGRSYGDQALVANNRLKPLIGQTIVLTSVKNRLTNQDQTSPVKDDFYLFACIGVYHSSYIIKSDPG